METIQGIVTDITFRNEDNGFSVIHFKPDGQTQTCIGVGVLTTVDRGQSLRLTGSWELHKRFGRQFTVTQYEIVRPATLEGIESLLGSGLICSIGTVRAKKIIETFGLQTLDVLDADPARLLEVPGIGEKSLEKISEAWLRQRHIRDLMVFLQECSVSVNLAHKIYKKYGENARESISRDPYALIDDIWGVGFVKADAIAQKMGFGHDSFKRIRAGLTHVMQESHGNGHTYLPAIQLTDTAAKLLGVPEAQTLFTLDHCVKESHFIEENGNIFLPGLFDAEKTVARLLAKRASAPNKVVAHYDAHAMNAWLAAYAKRTGWSADPKQLDAVRTACTHAALLLTGGPGTGKTTTLQVIVSFFREKAVPVALAAPTGKAAQRMGNIAGIKASTIHRLLEFRPGKDRYHFARTADNPIDAGVVIVDETSMIDIMLMKSLLSALRPDTAVLFVGDSNQLPSVGPGNVLADMIRSGCIAHIELSTIFRQAAQSRIITAAHEIIHGTTPVFSNEKDGNCFFIKEEDPLRCLSTVIDLATVRLPKSYGLSPVFDIQILSPMHRGPLGTHTINTEIQKILHSDSKKIVRGDQIFAVGDRVMQVKNNYDLGVFNGDIGYVVDCVDDAELLVDFEGQRAHYERKDLDELTHAYCISIHKSQGCEFKAVIIILMTQHYILLQRNLLYTAITRAKQLCIIIGMPKALSIAVQNNEAFHRFSSLSGKIREASRP
ncbi:MAG TPA: ATP-dependent RecD-like DNA helicase [Chitinivibrionales bacterium]